MHVNVETTSAFSNSLRIKMERKNVMASSFLLLYQENLYIISLYLKIFLFDSKLPLYLRYRTDKLVINPYKPKIKRERPI